ncbi:MAG: hypothetical protein IPG93_04615 [Burkholderiales bacterium]|nr:hypothetical protein [Burkholderiales bacterium]
MFMVLDAAKAVVDGAIKFAKAAAEMLGTFFVLIKDIASNPGGWISNLGAAVMDGVKNHLWKSFKSAIKGWFDSKLEEMLGVGTTVWNVLKKGGIAVKDVGQMAFEALKAAIPAALIQLLIEKVVAMIVPAAGAVLVIIEGLQAAWGTVHRLIAALGKFVAFLKAIKSGGAGPQFAELLAAGAVVVIDFVANWLLKKLRGPASKVGAKVKAIAAKIMAKVKTAMKKVGGALKKVAGKIGGVFRKGAKKIGDWRAKKKAKGAAAAKKKNHNVEKKDKKDDKAARLRKAVDALRPKLQQMVAKGKVSGLLVRARLLIWKVQHRLTKLALQNSGGSVQVIAQVNPADNVIAFVRKHGGELRKLIYDIAKEIFARPDVQESLLKHQKAIANGAGTLKEPLHVGSSADALALSQVLSEKRMRGATHVQFPGGGRAAVDRHPRTAAQHGQPLGPGMQHVREGGRYADHPALFEAAAQQDQRSVAAMQALANVTMLGGAGPHRAPAARDFAAQQALLKVVEMSRSGQAAVVTMEQAQLVGQGMIPHKQGIEGDPMTPQGAVGTSRSLERRTMAHEGGGDIKTKAPKLKMMIDQQIQFIASVMEARYGAENMMFKDEHGLTESVRTDVKVAIKRITEQNLALGQHDA